MKNLALAIHNDADDADFLNPRYACTRTRTYGPNRTLRHLRHNKIKTSIFGGSRAHTHIKKLARTDSANLFRLEAA